MQKVFGVYQRGAIYLVLQRNEMDLEDAVENWNELFNN